MTWHDDGLDAAMVRRGMSRRDFLKFSAAMTTALALPASYAPRIAAAVASAPRIPVIWLHGQACGGSTRALLQASKPTTAEQSPRSLVFRMSAGQVMWGGSLSLTVTLKVTLVL